jgi:outer membrane protein OmpA-like peptidoglycan-associated protein
MTKLFAVTMLALLSRGSLARAGGAAMSTGDARALAVTLTSAESAVLLHDIVHFDPGRVRVYSKSREKIQAIVHTWRQRTDWSVITVHGYAGGNAALGQRRAEKIRGYLIRYGIPPELVVALGHAGGATVDLSIELCQDASCRRTP